MPGGVTEILVWDSTKSDEPFDYIDTYSGVLTADRLYLTNGPAAWVQEPSNGRPFGVWDPGLKLGTHIFDVSRFSKVAAVYSMNGLKDDALPAEQNLTPTWLTTLRLYLEMSAAPEGPAELVLEAGLQNNFGASDMGATPFAHGYILAGAKADVMSSYYAEWQRCLPYARLALKMEGGFGMGTIPPGATKPGWKCRIGLVGW